MGRESSEELYREAVQYFPGGVNSPVRAFKSVIGSPLFIERGEGCNIYDADGNEYIDFCCSWGPLILGHNHPAIHNKVAKTIKNGLSFGAPTRLENELAKLILSNNSYIDKIRFVNSGTEALMSAIRLARGYTKRDKIIKFEGCYHGHSDHLLVKAGSGLATFGVSSSAGVPEVFANETIVLPLDDKQAVEEAFKKFKKEIACILIEPVPANNGLLIQKKEYLSFLREISAANDALLIFDEVISGFRIGFQGAADYYQIQPDIITYGKIIGGGMPVGAYGGKAGIMQLISPDGPVYQAGTLSGNPVAMSAGIAQLSECLKNNFYAQLNDITKKFVEEINHYITSKKYPMKVFSIASIFWIAFSKLDRITRADQIDSAGMELFKGFHHELLSRGIYLGPSGYEVSFISSAHAQKDLDKAKEAIYQSLDVVFDSK